MKAAPIVNIVGAGMAGCEIAYFLAERGIAVRLFEQKPQDRTPASRSDWFAEMVCSNSFRSNSPSNAIGLLKQEMMAMGSLVLQVALQAQVPAGDALAVDRNRFGQIITETIERHPRIQVVCAKLQQLPSSADGITVVATGPLTDGELAADIMRCAGSKQLYFYDALSPIVSGDSIDRDVAFAASRYNKNDDQAYWNLPLSQAQYAACIAFLQQAETYPSHSFEQAKFFAGCMPLEELAKKGPNTLRFGPLKPVGLHNPHRQSRPYAVIQLRPEDRHGHAYSLVGCQTKLLRHEQATWLNSLPGLRNVEILRYGAMHRNTYVNAPDILAGNMALRNAPHIRLAGQITGVEGYAESAAHGLCVAYMLYAELRGLKAKPPPPSCALGALWAHTTEPGQTTYEPHNVHFGLFAPMPVPTQRRNKQDWRAARIKRAEQTFDEWLKQTYQPIASAA